MHSVAPFKITKAFMLGRIHIHILSFIFFKDKSFKKRYIYLSLLCSTDVNE